MGLRAERKGKIFDFPEGVTEEEAELSMMQSNPELFPDMPRGFVPALKSGWESMSGSVAAMPDIALGAITGDDEQLQRGIRSLEKSEMRASQELPDPVTIDDVVEDYQQEGVFSALGTGFNLAKEGMGQSATYMLPMFGAAKLAKTATAGAMAARAIPAIASKAGTGVIPAAQVAMTHGAGASSMIPVFFAENLARQVQEGAATPEEIKVLKAFAAAPFQSAMEYIFVALMDPTRVAARIAAKQSLSQFIRKQAVEASSEIPTEMAQTALTMLQADTLTPSDAEDLKEIIYSGIMGGVVGGGYGAVSTAVQAPGVMLAKARFDEDLKGEKIIRDKVKEQSDRDLAEEQQLILNGDDEGLRNLQLGFGFLDEAEETLRNEAVAGLAGRDVAPEDIHRAAESRNLNWDDDAGFMAFSKRVTGKSKIDDMDAAERRNLYEKLMKLSKQKNTNTSLPAFIESEYEGALLYHQTKRGKKGKVGSPAKPITVDSIREALGLGNSSEDLATAREIRKEAERRGEAVRKDGKLMPFRRQYNESQYREILRQSRDRVNPATGKPEPMVTKDIVEGVLEKTNFRLVNKIRSDMLKRKDAQKKGTSYVPISISEVLQSRTLSSKQGKGFFVRDGTGNVVGGAATSREARKLAKDMEVEGTQYSLYQDDEVIATYNRKPGDPDPRRTVRKAMSRAKKKNPESAVRIEESAPKFTASPKSEDGFSIIEEGLSLQGNKFRKTVDFVNDEATANTRISEGEVELQGAAPFEEGVSRDVERQVREQKPQFIADRLVGRKTLEEEIAWRKQLLTGLQKVLSGIGLEGVRVRLANTVGALDSEGLGAEGNANINNVITVSLQHLDPNAKVEDQIDTLIDVMNHEMVHSMKYLDLFTQEEWESLKNYVRETVVPNDPDSRTYLQRAVDINPDLDPEGIYEEAIAEAFRGFVRAPKNFNGEPKTLMERIKRFLTKVGNYLLFNNFSSPQEILQSIRSGEIASRERGEIRTLKDVGTPWGQNIVDLAESQEDPDKLPMETDVAPMESRLTAENLTKLQISIPGLKAVIPYLTVPEREKLTAKTAKKLVDMFEGLPSEDEIASVAYAGRLKRGWYRDSAQAILDVFGAVDATRFAALLAATSPQTPVEANAEAAINIWVNWNEAGRPTRRKEIVDIMGRSVRGERGADSVLGAWIPNTVRALTSEDPSALDIQQEVLSGAKVNSFMLNLRDNVNEVTNDAWMSYLLGIDKERLGGLKIPKTRYGEEGVMDPGKTYGYMAASATIRKAADVLSSRTGQTWTPAEVQETAWSWAKALTEQTLSAEEQRSALEIVTDQRGPDAERLIETPDFSLLFTSGVYEKILEGGGYGEGLRLARERREAAQIDREGGRGVEDEDPGIAERTFDAHLRRAAARLDERVKQGPVEEFVAAEGDVTGKDRAPEHLRRIGLYGDLPGGGQGLLLPGGVTLEGLRENARTSARRGGPDAAVASSIARALGIEVRPGESTADEVKIYPLWDLATTVDGANEILRPWLERSGWNYKIFGPDEQGKGFTIPNFDEDSYDQGTAWIYQPTDPNGSFRDHPYTLLWRVTHEVGHGLTNPELTSRYGGIGRRAGAMGVITPGPYTKPKAALTLADALRSVEWEHEAFKEQRRVLEEELGIRITDEEFAKENSINLSDAVYRVITGQFGNPSDYGIVPTAVDPEVMLERAKNILRSAAAEMGIDSSETFDIPTKESRTANRAASRGFIDVPPKESRTVILPPRDTVVLPDEGSSAATQAFMDEFIDISHPYPFGGTAGERVFGVKIDGEVYNVNVEISPGYTEDSVRLNWIQATPSASKGERGSGAGSYILGRITDLADKHGVAIEGTVGRAPGMDKDTGLSVPDLKKWYKRHGFASDPDLASGEKLVRKPRATDVPTKESRAAPTTRAAEGALDRIWNPGSRLGGEETIGEWLDRHGVERTDDGRFVFYHATPTEGGATTSIRAGSQLETDPESASSFATGTHGVARDQVTVHKLYLTPDEIAGGHFGSLRKDVDIAAATSPTPRAAPTTKESRVGEGVDRREISLTGAEQRLFNELRVGNLIEGAESGLLDVQDGRIIIDWNRRDEFENFIEDFVTRRESGEGRLPPSFYKGDFISRAVPAPTIEEALVPPNKYSRVGAIPRINTAASERAQQIARGEIQGQKMSKNDWKQVYLQTPRHSYLDKHLPGARKVSDLFKVPEKTTFFDLFMGVVGERSPEQWKKWMLMIRQKFVDKYAAIASLEGDVVKKMREEGKSERQILVRVMAHQSAAGAAYRSDRGRGILQAAINVGIPILKAGRATVQELEIDIIDPKTGATRKGTGGFSQIFRPLFRNHLGENIYSDWVTLRTAYRERRFANEGRGDVTDKKTKAIIRKGLRQLDEDTRDNLIADYEAALVDPAHAFHQKANIIKTVNKNFDKWNEGFVQFLVDTGVIDEDAKELWTKYNDYIPFYRQFDEDGTGEEDVLINAVIDVARKNNPGIPKVVMGSLTGAKPPVKAMEGSMPVIDPLASILHNSLAAITSGLKNDAAQKVMRDGMYVGMARKLGIKGQYNEENPPVYDREGNMVSEEGGEPAAEWTIHEVRENGQTVQYEIVDKLLHNSLENFTDGKLPYLSFVAAPSTLLREMVTRSPDFMLANLLRDTVSAWATSGSSFTPVTDTFKHILSNQEKSTSWNALTNAGVNMGYDFGRDMVDARNEVMKQWKREGVLDDPSSGAWKMMNKIWDWAGDMTTKTDMATRQAVYEDVFARLKDEHGVDIAEAEAEFQAQEVINFGRRGNSTLARYLTAAVPFLNARIQGIDVLYRAGTGRYSANMDKVVQQKSQLAFIARMGMLASVATVYWMMVHDDDEYRDARPEVRQDNLILPNFGLTKGSIKIPKPFEVGFIAFTIPEMIAELTFGKQDLRQTTEAIKRGIMVTFEFNPVPQAIRPVYEAYINRSFFTGRPIVPYFQQGMKPELQAGDYTNTFALMLGELFNASPSKIEHVLRGYTGTLGSYALFAADTAVRPLTDYPTRPDMPVDKMPMFRRFWQGENGGGKLAEFYDFREASEEITNSIMSLRKKGRHEEAKDLMQDSMGVMQTQGTRKSIDRALQRLRRHEKNIMYSNMTGPEKRNAQDKIKEIQKRILRDIEGIRRKADLPTDLPFPLSAFN